MKPVTDHQGIEYPSVSAMCSAYNIPVRTYHGRRKAGLSLETALTTPVKEMGGKGKPTRDYKGNDYPSICAMCKVYGLSRNVYEQRVKYGWSQEKALTTPVGERKRGKPVTDHKGVKYPSIKDMCAAYNIPVSVYSGRVMTGWSMEAALTTPVGGRGNARRSIDHKGVEYPSIKAMCEAYGISRDVYDNRREIGWTVEKALTTPAGEAGRRGDGITDHKGVRYDSVTAMCKAYNLPISVYFHRILRGWSREEALTEPVTGPGRS